MLSPQVLIIALLAALLIGILIGYFLMQGRLRRQDEALKASQRRHLAELEAAHESRLRETTQRLRQDYEAELATTIEHYQDQLSDKTSELQQIYETRFRVVQDSVITSADASGQGSQSNGNLGIDQAPLSQPEVRHLKRQYEKRLKEAAQKLQQAYEKQLTQHAKTVRAELHAEYEQRLAAKTKEYETQIAARDAQLNQTLMGRHETPHKIDESTLTLASREPSPLPKTPSPSPVMIPTQEDIDARIREATQQIQQNYEQQLSAKLEEYQDRLSSRVQELETDYRNRLDAIASAQAATANQPARQNPDDSFDPLDLSDIAPNQDPTANN